MDGASLFDKASPGLYTPGCAIYKLAPNTRRCRNGYRKNKAGYCVKKSVGSPKTKKISPKSSVGSPKTQKISPKSSVGSPKTQKVSPKDIIIQMMDGLEISLPPNTKTIGAVKNQLEKSQNIPIAEQVIYSEMSEKPLENKKGRLAQLGTLMMIRTAPVPPEFKNLDNWHTQDFKLNRRRVVMKILLDHKDNTLTFEQILALDVMPAYDPYRNPRDVIIYNIVQSFNRNGLVILTPEPESIWAVRHQQAIDETEGREARTFTVELNREHPYIATLF